MLGILCFLVNAAVSLYIWIIIIAVLLTFVQPNPFNPAVQFIRKATEPLFYYTRKYLSFLTYSGIDFSPIVVVFALQFIPKIICSIFWM